jgi:hypothetical protein
MVQLAACAAIGRGMSQSAACAAKWLKEASLLGSQDAWYFLGMAHEEGDLKSCGVKQSIKEASEAYRYVQTFEISKVLEHKCSDIVSICEVHEPRQISRRRESGTLVRRRSVSGGPWG